MTATSDHYAHQTNRRDVVVTDDHYVERPDAVTQIARVASLVAGGLVTIVGLIALARIEWSGADLDSPIVGVADMTFTPLVAGITTLVGIILLAVAAGRRGEGRIAMGAILTTLGIAVVAVNDLKDSWHLTDRQGWFTIAVGVAFLLAGLLTEGRYAARRHHAAVERDRAVDAY